MMLRSILSPVDFSEHSRHALRWAGAFAARFQSRLTVISVVDPLLAEAARIRLGQDLAKAETEPALREFVAATWSGGARAPEQTVFKTIDWRAGYRHSRDSDGGRSRPDRHGHTRARRVPQVAARVDDGAPATTNTRPGPGRALLASESDAVPQHRGLEISHILAATDFSDSSVTAAQTAVDLAVRCPRL